MYRNYNHALVDVCPGGRTLEEKVRQRAEGEAVKRCPHEWISFIKDWSFFIQSSHQDNSSLTTQVGARNRFACRKVP